MNAQGNVSSKKGCDKMTQRRMTANEHAQNALLLTILTAVSVSFAHGAGIETYLKNAAYWQYDGEPAMLLAGTDGKTYRKTYRF